MAVKQKKLYYTDPLKAAYMAREFGVVTADNEGQVFAPGIHIYEHFLSIESGYVLEDAKLYICRKNYPIFETQVGDLVTDSNNKVFGTMINSTSISVPERHNGKEFYCLNSHIKIIQRNNKPFFMPEVEQ